MPKRVFRRDRPWPRLCLGRNRANVSRCARRRNMRASWYVCEHVVEGRTAQKMKYGTAFPCFSQTHMSIPARQLNLKAFLDGFTVFRALIVQQGQADMEIA